MLTLPVYHTRQTPRHELQTALPLLRRRVHLPDIVYVENPAGHGDHQRIPRQIHMVHALREIM